VSLSEKEIALKTIQAIMPGVYGHLEKAAKEAGQPLSAYLARCFPY
jgi:hypothetical protein